MLVTQWGGSGNACVRVRRARTHESITKMKKTCFAVWTLNSLLRQT
jgi:hypothetical protein